MQTLSEMCKNLLVEQIKNLPPLLKEQVIGETTKQIKSSIQKEILKDIRGSALIVVDNMTDILINCYDTGCSYQRPEYTKDLPDELYYTMVQISEKMLDKYYCTERRYYHPEIDDTRYSDMEYSNIEDL